MLARLRGRPAAAILLAVLAGSVLAACGDDDTQADSTDAGALVVYAGRDEELIAPLLKQFTDETGVELEVRYAGTTEHAATLLEEGDATPADVFISQDAGALGALANEGLLQELPESITGAVKAEFSSEDDSWVGLTGRARVIAYDSEALDADEVPTTMAELLEPQWKGKFAIAPGNASFQAFVTGFRAAEGEEAAATWLKGIAANDVQKFEKNGEILQAVNSGTVQLGLINHYYAYALAAESDTEVDQLRAQLSFPEAGDPGALVNVTGAAALSDHPDAQKLIAYLVSEAGQTYFTEQTFEYPLIEGVPAPAGLPALEDIKGPVEDLAELADLETTINAIQEAGLN